MEDTIYRNLSYLLCPLGTVTHSKSTLTLEDAFSWPALTTEQKANQLKAHSAGASELTLKPFHVIVAFNPGDDP